MRYKYMPIPSKTQINVASTQKCLDDRAFSTVSFNLMLAVFISACAPSILKSMFSIAGCCLAISSSMSAPRRFKVCKPRLISSKSVSCVFFLSSNS